MTIRDKIEIIQDNIKNISGIKQSDIDLVAVSKRVDTARMKIAQNCGINSFGENYVQEFRSKIEQISDVRWHFIGQLQSNKVKYIFREIYMLHSLDRMSLASELHKRLSCENLKMKVLVQINISCEAQKGGVMPDDVEQFLNELTPFESLDVCGLMCIPALEHNKIETIKDFAAARDIYDNMKSTGYNMRYLSMGMSNDYEDALRQGANIVRVGSAIFGMRT